MTVLSITDGDTMVVSFVDGTADTVRLIGINTPEGGECWAEPASIALATLAPGGSQVGLTTDVSDRDQFDRLLRYVWVGSMSVNEELVRRGAGISRRYPPDTSLAPRFESAQIDAQADQLGLWAPDACGPPVEADLRIVDLVYDAPGNDNDNLNEEWIRVRNNGLNLVDLSGWGIKDESASNRYAFPLGFSLGPGETVTVYSGCGDDFGTNLFWCSVGSAIWNNDGDTAFLTDPNGNVHATRSFT
ncbi:MAG: lamin tail domain-containing protein [Acidimicrobiia bacterium]